MKLIVNADDFGITDGVTLGILHAMEHGIVTSTTMMVNTPGAQAAAPRGAAFRACGFDDTSHDLTTRVWLVRADRSTGAVAALKSLYTQETRAELARVLHRIEYGVRAEENIERLQALCTREGIFRDYLEDFMREVVTHPARLSCIIERLRLT